MTDVPCPDLESPIVRKLNSLRDVLYLDAAGIGGIYALLTHLEWLYLLNIDGDDITGRLHAYFLPSI